ncbi:MAG: hypothetical protein QM626_03485 [Microbacterium sp.]|uniref:hypothetical protein n=1 Tax=Microbacterium sp. TaxID=51671 RepID=UPI0039E5DACF
MSTLSRDAHLLVPDVLPPAAEVDADEIALERTGFDSYALVRGMMVVGFVEVVGRVHVVYQGARMDRAVEIAQVLDLAAAVRVLADVL